MNGLFGDNIFFLFLFACITIMNYSRMSETQKMILFYLMTFGLAILKIISINESLLFLFIVSFLYLEFLTEDSEKIKFITKLRYKLLDFFFLMVFQYQFILLLISFVFASTRFQTYISYMNFFPSNLSNSLVQLLSIIFFFIAIFRMSQEKFKIKSFHALLTEVFIPPINESDLDPYEKYFEILVRMEDKTYLSRKKIGHAISFELLSSKTKNFWKSIRSVGFKGTLKIYGNIPQFFRGYSTLEMQLVRSVALDSGYNQTLTKKVFEILYTIIIFNSMKEYYNRNDYVNSDRFKEYLLSVYVYNIRTNINGTVFSNMIKYLGNDINDWSQEKFYLACLGLPYQEFSPYYILELYKDIIDELSLDTDFIKSEVNRLGSIERNYYGAEKETTEYIF
ncbi:hypothetical protein UAY_02303 [Enterococcus moraviensis ATCC BAA-383]|uniref:Uncharacterized protein n=1 Tax=Enterococcus moraviensis ATCC BAA-383 TaxID=1158609 RepID=R2TFV8_9ENTE|nr:hypothetical protein [Enterococcus moraviensis]EOH99034.1 hypothetical protein UAY_02303 [Enterococcus moraviensis ATCC BAA-383]EOT71791.1 hypothetical protein I586_01598 [Enterococcus moraviensis ATCC BAA-383]OJG67911.1 hypothetical protein RV09_GL002022 [Enterococcus moraviensis]